MVIIAVIWLFYIWLFVASILEAGIKSVDAYEIFALLISMIIVFVGTLSFGRLAARIWKWFTM